MRKVNPKTLTHAEKTFSMSFRYSLLMGIYYFCWSCVNNSAISNRGTAGLSRTILPRVKAVYLNRWITAVYIWSWFRLNPVSRFGGLKSIIFNFIFTLHNHYSLSWYDFLTPLFHSSCVDKILVNSRTDFNLHFPNLQVVLQIYTLMGWCG